MRLKVDPKEPLPFITPAGEGVLAEEQAAELSVLGRLNQLAGISVPEPHQIVIQPWDRSVLNAIEKAITKSDIGLVPNVDGAVVRLNIPPLTEERRKDLVRVVHKRMEEARVEIRNIRRDANEHLKREEREGTIGTDESHRQSEMLQKTTDRHIAEVDRRGAAKEQEVLEV